VPLSEAILTLQDRDNLQRAERLWQQLRSPGPRAAEAVILRSTGRLGAVDWDVIVAGGTLGIMLAAALARRGLRVVLIERGTLVGRAQEWNVSRPDLDIFVKLGLLSADQLELAIVSCSTTARVAIAGGTPVPVQGVLDVGVDPVYLLAVLKERFLAAGGTLFEHAPFERVAVHPDGVAVAAGEQRLSSRLFLDAMGHFSPVVRQARRAARPDGVCLVVGSCAQGFATNNETDLIASITPMLNRCQYLWEAFPARDGRTTYLFTYLDAHPGRLGLGELFEEYLRLLPAYQGTPLDRLRFRRLLFGLFPSYRQHLDLTGWDRLLAVGDSAGNQSPLSFGGFGAMLRHLGRLEAGIAEALAADCLGGWDLQRLQPYQPNLAVSWLFQRAMSVGVDQQVNPDRINRLLATVFAQMEALGDGVLRPFLQDVVRLDALSTTLARVALADPGLVLALVGHLGPGALAEWAGHYLNLVGYTALDRLGSTLHGPIESLPPPARYRANRRLEAWRYGSGYDLME
jgi:lycopene cyclase CruP